MAYIMKNWVNRQVEHPNRRNLIQVSGNTYDTERAEGLIFDEGDPFNAATMNEFENRVAAAFREADTDIGGKAPISHASTATTYGAGNATNFGHLKVSDNYTSSAGTAAGGVAASSQAVYNTYNTLNGAKAPNSHASTGTTYGVGTSSNYGHLKVSDSYTSSAGAAANGVAASSQAVYNAWSVANSANNTANGKAPTNHASTGNSYGQGNASYFGHVKVSDNYTSSAGTASGGVAASSSAVYKAWSAVDTTAVKLTGNQVIEGTKTFYALALGSETVALGAGARSGSYGIAVGYTANTSGRSHSIAIGYNARVNADSAIALGENATTNNGYGAVAIGRGANSAYHGVAIGHGSACSNSHSIAIGSNARTNLAFGTAMGTEAYASHNYAVAIGDNARAFQTYAVALGGQSVATNEAATALGFKTSANGYRSTALGYEATASTSDNSVMYLGGSSLSALRCRVGLNVTSDERDKADIAGLSGGLDFIGRVAPIHYVNNERQNYLDRENLSGKDRENYDKYGLCEYDREAHAAGEKKGQRQRVGVSAQQVREALEAVYGTADYADLVNDNLHDVKARGEEIPEGVEDQLTVNYSGFVPFLIQSVRELSERTQRQQDEIDGLRALVQTK